MAIFNSYVSLPEGKQTVPGEEQIQLAEPEADFPSDMDVEQIGGAQRAVPKAKFQQLSIT